MINTSSSTFETEIQNRMAKVMLAIDDSEHSLRALNFYCENIRRSDDAVILIHVTEIPYHLAYNQPLRAEVAQKILNEAKAAAAPTEEKFKKILTEKQMEFRLVSEFGNPGEVIVKTAQEEGVAMVVMGTRGMGKLRRTILGSVSDYVVHHAHCPVIISRH